MHTPTVSTPEQYFRRGETLLANGYAAEETRAEVGFVQTDTKRIYEWKIQLGDAFKLGRSFGFDLDVTDKDEDGSFTWLAFGRGTQKAYYPASLGDLFLLPGDTELGSVSGRLAWAGENHELPFPNVSIQSFIDPGMRVEAICDPFGNYEAQLPAGKYVASPVGGQGARVIESDHVHLEVSAGTETVAGGLGVSLLPKPDLIGEKGILREGEFDREDVDRFVRAYMEHYQIPGISLAVLADSKIAYHQVYGDENAVTEKALTEDSVLEACSLTKPVFAFAVNRLVERGILELDTPLLKYLPEPEGYESILGDERAHQITARHVLTHRTGFPNWRRGDKLSVSFEPGKGYGYSGEGFELLGAVVCHLTKKSLLEVLQEEVFDPLKIENAHLVWSDQLAARVGNGHSMGKSPVVKSKTSYPGMAYSLHINAPNYANLLGAILRREGLKLETYTEMLRQQFERVDLENPHEFPYGLGLVAEKTPLGKRLSHGGVNPGWRCRFAIFDDLKMGYVVFTNNEHGLDFAADLEKFLVTGSSE